jgi:dynein axonemal light intermediate chain 1
MDSKTAVALDQKHASMDAVSSAPYSTGAAGSATDAMDYHGQTAHGDLLHYTEQDAVRDSLVEYGDAIRADEYDRVCAPKKSKKASIPTVLNSILPPRALAVDGEVYKQPVSLRKPERDDVIRLQMRLDEQLQMRQARESGLCPVREQLYSQCFDELIRQVAIERPERGLLLVRVRDEVKMTIAAYQTLYNNSVSFGMAKTRESQKTNDEMEERVKALRAQKSQLQDQLSAEQQRFEMLQKRGSEKRGAAEKRVVEQKNFLKQQIQHLEAFLKNVA